MLLRISLVACSICLVNCLGSIPASATLIDNGDGTITDPGSGLMWVQDVKLSRSLDPSDPSYDHDGLMGWDAARNWAEDLVFAGYGDWRLPVLPNSTCRPSVNGPCNQGEIGQLFYDVLGNPGGIASPVDPGPFLSLEAQWIWSSTPYSGDYSRIFSTIDGSRVAQHNNTLVAAWAVRNVAAVPEPGTVSLLLAGLLGLAAARRRAR